MSLDIRDVNPEGEDAMALLREASAEARALYPELFVGITREPVNAPLAERSRFVVAYVDGCASGCGSLRPLSRETGAVGRMYVRRSARRSGVASALLKHLAREALRLGYERLVLETGYKQAPAMRLYEANGFRRIAPFGPYANDPTSVCYECPLPSADA